MNVPQRPFVSVVVCAHNEAKLLRACLEALGRQTYPASRSEILVIDDGSSDGTAQIAQDFARALGPDAPRVRVVQKTHGGLSDSRNVGVQLSEGDLIAFTDGDAVAHPSWLERLVDGFREGADYVGGRIDLLNDGSWLGRFLQATRYRQFFGPALYNDQFIGCNMAYRREVFAVAGGFDERFVARGDESTFREGLPARFRYGAAPDAVVLHERPETLASYFRTEWRSATLGALAQRVLGRGPGWRVLALRLEQLLLLAWIPAVLAALALGGWMTLGAAVTTIAVVRRLFLRPVSREVARGLRDSYGAVRGTAAHLAFGIALEGVHLLGAIAGSVAHRRAPMVATAERSFILSVHDTRAARAQAEAPSLSRPS